MRRRILEKGYVTVRPTEETVYWVTPDVPVEYNVYSNTKWNIE